MTEKDVEIILLPARKKFPHATPSIISDNRTWFIAKDCKKFIWVAGLPQVRTLPFFPQSSDKPKHYHRTMRSECFRPKVLLALAESRSQITTNISYFNKERFYSASGYVAATVKPEGRERQIFTARDRKLEQPGRPGSNNGGSKNFAPLHNREPPREGSLTL